MKECIVACRTDSRRSPRGPNVVVFLESAAAMGGIQRTTLDLVRRLDRTRWQPLVVCPEEGDLAHSCRAADVKVRILPSAPLYSTSIWTGNGKRLPNPIAWSWDIGAIVATAGRVAQLLAQEGPDLLVTKGLFSHFYGGLAARKTGIPCLWYVQDFISERFGGVYQRAFGQAARWLPTRIVAIGPPIIRQLPEAVRGRARVIYNAVDTKVFRSSLAGAGVRRELGIEPEALVVGNVARLTPWKGQHHLLKAFAQLAVEMPKARLLFVGAPLFDSNAYELQLRSNARELGLSHRVIFAGHRDDVPRVLAAMDVFAYCAMEKDICPLSLLEAMASGLPVVAFDIQGMREAIVDGEEGLLVPVSQVEPLARALTRLITDGELRRRLGERARRRVEEKFSLDHHVSLVEDTLLDVLTCAAGLSRPAAS